MKKLFLSILILLTITSCTPGYDAVSSPTPDYIIVVAALDEMYWMEYYGKFSKYQLDNIENDEDVQAAVEKEIKCKLTPELLKAIAEKRKTAKYDI